MILIFFKLIQRYTNMGWEYHNPPVGERDYNVIPAFHAGERD
jgi:hypothetical protein